MLYCSRHCKKTSSMPVVLVLFISPFYLPENTQPQLHQLQAQPYSPRGGKFVDTPGFQWMILKPNTNHSASRCLCSCCPLLQSSSICGIQALRVSVGLCPLRTYKVTVETPINNLWLSCFISLSSCFSISRSNIKSRARAFLCDIYKTYHVRFVFPFSHNHTSTNQASNQYTRLQPHSLYNYAIHFYHCSCAGRSWLCSSTIFLDHIVLACPCPYQQARTQVQCSWCSQRCLGPGHHRCTDRWS